MNFNFSKLSLNGIYLTLFASISATSVWIYRGNPGDIGIISDAGQKILMGVNPYVESEFANSPVTAVAIHLFASIVPSTIFLTAIQLLNIIGIVVFVKFVLSYFEVPDKSSLIIFVVTLTISYRALIANVQLTGILLALFVLSEKLTTKPASAQKFLGYLVILMAFELKPQIVLPLLLLVFLRNRDYWLKLGAALCILVCHIVLNIYFGAVLEVLWIEKISAFSDKSFLEGPEISIWKAVVHFSGSLTFTKLISTMALVLFYLILIFLIFGNHRNALIVCLAAPFIGSYAHMYDLLGLFIVFLALNFKNIPLNIPMILLLVIPYDTQIVPLIICSVLVLIFVQFTSGDKPFVLGNRYISWTIASIILLLTVNFIDSNDQELSLSLRLILVILVYGFAEIRRQSPSLS